MHVPDLARALAELGRVLAPGGTLVVSELNARSPEAWASRLRSRAKSSPFENKPSGPERWLNSAGEGMLIRHADPDWLVAEFAKHGLRLRERVIGQVSESYAALPRLQRPIGWVNRRLAWSKLPGVAVSNIFVFRS